MDALQQRLGQLKKKKKLSSFFWIQILFAIVIFITVGFVLVLTEIYKLNSRPVQFISVQAVGPEVQKYSIDNHLKEIKELDDNFPVFHFSGERVVFGPIKSMVAPEPSDDVMVMKRKQWAQDFSHKYKTFKHQLRNENVIGISYQNIQEQNESILDLYELKKLVKTTLLHDSKSLEPQFVFINLTTYAMRQ